MNFAEFAMAQNQGAGDKVKIDSAIQACMLLDAYADYTKRHDFKPGDLIQMKAWIGAFTDVLQDGAPGIVVEKFAPPRSNPAASPGTMEYGMEFDLFVMCIDPEGDAVMCAFDSRFLEPYRGKIEK